MAADPHVQEAHWAAPIPDGCSEPAGLPLDGSAVRTADDHCAPADHPVPDGRSADSALDDSVARTADDHYALADHPVPDGRSADSALDDLVVPMDDHCSPADHPVPDGRSADSAQDDSVVLMTDDHCVPAGHSALGVRSAPVDSVAADCSADWLRVDCWLRADSRAPDSPRAGRFPVVRLGRVPGLAARVWLEERP
jgi:hypothetical protein